MSTVNIDDMTIGQIKTLSSMFDHNDSFQPFQIGDAYLIRTVTHITIGIVTHVGDKEVIMVDASWIADTGRYSDALHKGTLSEVEPYPDDQQVIIGRGAIVDATIWNHDLPREQK